MKNHAPAYIDSRNAMGSFYWPHGGVGPPEPVIENEINRRLGDGRQNSRKPIALS